MRRRLWRLSLVWAVAGCVLWFATYPAAADKATTGTSAESWYQVAGCTVAQCALPTELPVPLPTTLPTAAPIPSPSANPFPAGTLHVGLLAGQEQARTYVKLDLSSVPFDARLNGGTMTLTIAADQQSGTVSPDTAKINACFMVHEFHGGDAGVVAAPPEPDCTTSAPLHLVTQQNAQAFTVDLAKFAERWANGEPNNGLALLASDDAKNAHDTWAVAIFGKGSTGAQIKAELDFTPAPPLPVPQAVPPVYIPPGLVPIPIPTFQPAPVPTPPPVVPPPVAITTRGFEYAAIFLLPLVGLCVSSALGYSFTREVVLPDA